VSELLPGQKFNMLLTESLRDAYDKGIQLGKKRERERIIDLLENQIYSREYEGFFWKDTIDKVSIPDLVARIKGEQNV
jgi:hypothetical protein